MSNPILTKKENEQLQMCIDYTNLNKACSKDNFSLPRLDQIIDSTFRCQYLYLINTYYGYHHIRMRKKDVPLTSFITPFGTYCYEIMPFGLKKAGCPYQGTMHEAFCTQIRENIEVHIDALVIKSKQMSDLIPDLIQTFGNL